MTSDGRVTLESLDDLSDSDLFFIKEICKTEDVCMYSLADLLNLDQITTTSLKNTRTPGEYYHQQQTTPPLISYCGQGKIVFDQIRYRRWDGPCLYDRFLIKLTVKQIFRDVIRHRGETVAAEIIQRWWLDQFYNPARMVCLRRLERISFVWESKYVPDFAD